MILDRLNEFCDQVSLNTGAAGTYLLGNQINLGLPARDVGVEDSPWLVISAATAITVASGTGTVSFSLASDTTAAISTSTSVIHATSPARATSTTAIPAGTLLFAVKLPLGTPDYRQFLGILQTTTGSAINAGSIDAFLTLDVAKWKPYADAVN